MSDADEVQYFHPSPGARERHLQRCYQNPLFGDAARVNQVQVEAAHEADVAEADEFVTAVKELFDGATSLAANVESDVILEMKGNCDRLYEQSCGLGGDTSKEQGAIKRLTEVLMKAVWQGAGNDVQAREELEQEEEARAEHYRLLGFPLVADLLRPDSPIGEDHLVPVLLSEEEDAVSQALLMFAPEHRVLLVDQADKLLETLEQEGVKTDSWRARLTFIRKF